MHIYISLPLQFVVKYTIYKYVEVVRACDERAGHIDRLKDSVKRARRRNFIELD